MFNLVFQLLVGSNTTLNGATARTCATGLPGHDAPRPKERHGDQANRIASDDAPHPDRSCTPYRNVRRGRCIGVFGRMNSAYLTNDDGDGSGRGGDSDDGANGACRTA